MPIPKSYPLESFDPRFKELLLRGARGEDFTIQCRTRAEAYRLQHMLNAYRARAKTTFGEAKPDEWKPLFICAIGLEKGSTGEKTIVHIYSRHKEFEDVLSSVKPGAPLTEPVLSSDPLAEFDASEPPKPLE